MILGLDLSTKNTGYAVMRLRLGDSGDLITQFNRKYENINEELVTYGNIIPSDKINHSRKLRFIYNRIKELIKEYNIRVVVIEDQYLRMNVETLKLLARVSGVAMLAAEEGRCRIVLYPAPTIKKEFTGSGKANKDDIMNMAIKRYKLDRNEIDDNTTDAIAIAYTFVKKELTKKGR